MAALLAVSIAGLIIYSQMDIAGKNNGYVDTQKYFAEGGIKNEPRVNDSSIYDKEYSDVCGNLPLYCYQMTSCSQAIEAFECGNYDLDGDEDGMPCESICGNY